MNSTSDPRPTATTEALPHHLRRGGTSAVLDLLPDRFPVVRHWGEDLGDLGDAALTDLRTAQTMSTGTNRTWTASDLPVLPLPHLGWSACPALLLHRQDGSVFSAHVDSVSHEVTMDEGPGGAADVVVSRGGATPFTASTSSPRSVWSPPAWCGCARGSPTSPRRGPPRWRLTRSPCCCPSPPTPSSCSI